MLPTKDKLVIFDLDGTLLDTIDDLAAAADHTLGLRGLPSHTRAEYFTMVGHGVRNLVTQALPEEMRDEKSVDSALSDFMAYYSTHIDVMTRPYPGMSELIEKLDSEGYRLAVASNKFQAGVSRLIEVFFPGIPFVQVLGNNPGCPLKPSPEIVFSLMARAGISREQAPGSVLMVGDSLTDVRTALNACIPVVAVTWGFRPAEDFADVPYVAEDAAQLQVVIRRILG